MNEGSDDDSTLFRELFGDVKPLAHDRAADERPKPDAVARFRRKDEAQVLSDSLSSNPDDIDLDNGDQLSFRRPNISEKVLRKLRRGGYTVQEELDLHGLTAGEAQVVLRILPDFGEKWREGLPAPVEVISDPSRQESNAPIRKVKGLLLAYAQRDRSFFHR